MGVSDNLAANSPLSNVKSTPPHYLGRFAPSPTGPLHFGSLIAATASYLCARQHNNSQWLLRIEDVDTQREQQGAVLSIIQTLESYGFAWDGEIVYQSQRDEYYLAALESLSDFVYPCSCTRKELRALSTSSASQYSYVYPGFCRDGIKNTAASNLSIRLKTNNETICFNDECQPQEYCQNIEKEVGDFILKRSDGLYAYHLAVVVDDALQQINHIVRGADLFDNTPRQIYLQGLLGYPTPKYLHFPIAVDDAGKKLSKQNLSPKVSSDKKRTTLVRTLEFLGQSPPLPSEFSTLDDLWLWAKQNWDSRKIPQVMTINAEQYL